MKTTVVHVWVKEGTEDAFIAATLENAQNSIREAGNLRFDFVQSDKEPTKFTLIEVYETAEQVAAHKETAHYLKWRQTVQDMMARPREGVPHRALFVPNAEVAASAHM
eukprot:TRINITY_DN1145_c0_g1_i1.p2 TRINITY_DN1145_c0_g1~~TRINITY_DN1145_c0_g1_i1.p2  ORF type:complete len:108 (+),score=39.31 TRINITY_DN1145_c0_g1_i1:55-378(+)